MEMMSRLILITYRFLWPQETIMKEDPRGCNSPRVPEPDNLKIVELQPVSAKDGIWNIVISMRR